MVTLKIYFSIFEKNILRALFLLSDYLLNFQHYEPSEKIFMKQIFINTN